MAKSDSKWTICILTLPVRVASLLRLLESTRQIKQSFDLNILGYGNESKCQDVHNVILQKCKSSQNINKLNISWKETTISEGRQFTLENTHTPFVAFIDDDISLTNDPLEIADRKMEQHPLALMGIKSYVCESRKIDKPKTSQYPYFRYRNILLGPVIGNFVATYSGLLKEVGGFDLKRRNWGEWIDLNFRLMNKGYLPGYVVTNTYLRHFINTPDSPTRDKKNRNLDILRGVIITALEYDLTDSPDDRFWQVVYNRYLEYAYDQTVEKERLFFDLVKIFNQVIKESTEIIQKSNLTFKPYEPLSETGWVNLYASSKQKLERFLV